MTPNRPNASNTPMDLLSDDCFSSVGDQPIVPRQGTLVWAQTDLLVSGPDSDATTLLLDAGKTVVSPTEERAAQPTAMQQRTPSSTALLMQFDPVTPELAEHHLQPGDLSTTLHASAMVAAPKEAGEDALLLDLQSGHLTPSVGTESFTRLMAVAGACACALPTE